VDGLQLRRTFDGAVAGVSPTLERKADMQEAATHAALSAARAVDLIHSCTGSIGIREEKSFARHFRDVHVLG